MPSRLQRELVHQRIFAAANGLVVAFAQTDAFEAHGFVQLDGDRVGWAHFEKDVLHVFVASAIQQRAMAPAIRAKNDTPPWYSSAQAPMNPLSTAPMRPNDTAVPTPVARMADG